MPDTPKLPELAFPPIRMRARHRGDGVEVWNECRGIWVVLTPEEWVRRHLVAYLVSRCGAPLRRCVEEYPVAVNGQPQRADVVVVGDRGEPVAVAECKAPDVAIGRRVLEQAMRYNTVLGARYLLLTNGLKHYCYERTAEGYRPCGGFPDLGPGR